MHLPEPGDLVFYVGNLGKPITSPLEWWHHIVDASIMKATHSDIVHVEVVVEFRMATGVALIPQSIGAISRGVTLHDLPMEYRYWAPTSTLCDPTKLMLAVKDLYGRVGERYGVGDIVNQGLLQVFGADSPTIAFDRSQDCSDLATKFLVDAGYPLPAELMTAPQRVTPAQLAAAVHALPRV